MRRTIQRVGSFAELKDAFYNDPNSILAVREKEFNEMPDLKNTTIEIARLQDGKEMRILLKPDPAHVPNPESYQHVIKMSKTSSDED